MGRVLANGPGDQGSIPGWVIPKTQKMLFDTSLLNIQHYKVFIKGKVEQSRESSSCWKRSIQVILDYNYIYKCKGNYISLFFRCI